MYGLFGIYGFKVGKDPSFRIGKPKKQACHGDPVEYIDIVFEKIHSVSLIVIIILFDIVSAFSFYIK
jgi:hypothetical protein